MRARHVLAMVERHITHNRYYEHRISSRIKGENLRENRGAAPMGGRIFIFRTPHKFFRKIGTYKIFSQNR
jgi:hypothetical protein